MADSKWFRNLLTAGIKEIKSKTGLKIKEIEAQLGKAVGRSRSTIDFWRRGNIPTQPAEIAGLAQEIVRRGKLDIKWLKQFLRSADYSEAEELCRSLFPDFVENLVPIAGESTFERHEQQLVGRDSLIDEIVTALERKDAPWLVTIDGMGGIGKTALAVTVASHLKRAGVFEKVIWLSGARRIEGIDPFPLMHTLTFDEILTTIGIELGHSEVVAMRGGEKIRQIKSLLNKHPVLLVLDNLETAVDAQDTIIEQLEPLLKPSKALLTSRVRFNKGDIYPISLEGLSTVDTINFMIVHASSRRNKVFEQVEPKKLEMVASATGGSPLAVQLVVSQLQRFKIDIVLEHLSEAKPLNHDEVKDEYGDFYRHIFMRSWALLNDDDERLLMTMAFYDSHEGADYEMLQMHSDLDTAVLKASIDNLWQYSFLEIGENRLEYKSYYIHPLTQYFVLSDMVQLDASSF